MPKHEAGNTLYMLINMNIGNRRARNALCFEKPNFAVTVQMDNIKAKTRPKIQMIRPKLYR